MVEKWHRPFIYNRFNTAPAADMIQSSKLVSCRHFGPRQQTPLSLTWFTLPWLSLGTNFVACASLLGDTSVQRVWKWCWILYIKTLRTNPLRHYRLCHLNVPPRAVTNQQFGHENGLNSVTTTHLPTNFVCISLQWNCASGRSKHYCVSQQHNGTVGGFLFCFVFLRSGTCPCPPWGLSCQLKMPRGPTA